MGILNLTPDSFSDGGLFNRMDAAIEHVGKMLHEGADIIDVGGYSSRPGAADISVGEEIERILAITEAILERYPEALVSVDTFRSEVAERMLQAGVHMINDISAGMLDSRMMEVVAAFDAPYIMMHLKGTPQTMQKDPRYLDVVASVWDYFVERISRAREAGIRDLILDPGFGFGKTIEHNYALLRSFADFNEFGLPMLAGISRKSMIYRLFKTGPEDTRELSAALHYQLLLSGARLLRVHDVKDSQRVVKLFRYIQDGIPVDEQ
jgi:dihydropteroate synthase